MTQKKQDSSDTDIQPIDSDPTKENFRENFNTDGNVSIEVTNTQATPSRPKPIPKESDD